MKNSNLICVMLIKRLEHEIHPVKMYVYIYGMHASTHLCTYVYMYTHIYTYNIYVSRNVLYRLCMYLKII